MRRSDITLTDLGYISLGAICVIGLIVLYPACNPAHDIANTAYGDEMADCVDKAASLAESKACRQKVRERWGVAVVERKDAGHD